MSQPFKCWGCDHWKKGEGDAVCLSCGKFSIKDYSYKPEYFEPHIIEELVPSTVVPDKLDSLDEREFTMLVQFTRGKMSMQRIAEYHGKTVMTVWRTLKSAEKKMGG